MCSFDREVPSGLWLETRVTDAALYIYSLSCSQARVALFAGLREYIILYIVVEMQVERKVRRVLFVNFHCSSRAYYICL